MRTKVVTILDASGSMLYLKQGTMEGFNAYLKTLKESKEQFDISLVQFNFSKNYIFRNKALHLVEELTDYNYRPDGGTALFDALCETIDEVGRDLASLPKEERPEKVVFVIITDGEENSSRRFTKSDVSQRINHQQNLYNWEFIYLGANQDSFKAQEWGIYANNIANYANTNIGATHAFLASAQGAVAMASGMSYNATETMKNLDVDDAA